MIIHFMELDSDHYGNSEKIYQSTTSSLEEFEERIKENWKEGLYKVYKPHEKMTIFTLAGNITITAWVGYRDLNEQIK